MAKSKMPNEQEIEEKKEKFLENGKEISGRKKIVSSKKSFLTSLSSEIEILLSQGATRINLKTAIKNTYNVDVSTKVIADFIKNELGSTEPVKNKVSSTRLSSFEIKKKMAKKEPTEDSL